MDLASAGPSTGEARHGTAGAAQHRLYGETKFMNSMLIQARQRMHVGSTGGAYFDQQRSRAQPTM